MTLNKPIVLAAVGLFLASVVLGLYLSKNTFFVTLEPAVQLPVSDCDLQKGPCSASVPGSGSISVEITPRPVKPMQDINLVLHANGVSVEKAALIFVGMDMNMGLNRFDLVADEGVFRGKGILPVCVRNRMDWEAQARITTPDGVYSAPFRFTTSKN